MVSDKNMNYRFTSDNEPTDEQLLTIMKEVEMDVRRKSKKRKSIIMANIQKEYLTARAMFPNL